MLPGEKPYPTRASAGYRLLILVLATSSLFHLACPGRQAGENTPEPQPVAACGPVSRGFDSDGDGISDAIEKSNPNLFGEGRCDRDQSTVRGEHHAGSVEGAVNLPDSGPGYEHWLGTDPGDADDWGTLTLAQCVEAVGRGLAEVGITMHFSDLSKQTGGPFFPHKTHQIGLEVDVHYPRKDGAADPIDISSDQQQFDASATRDLFEIFARSCEVAVVLAVVDQLGFSVDESDLPAIVDDPHRRSSFLVRLRKPTNKAP